MSNRISGGLLPGKVDVAWLLLLLLRHWWNKALRLGPGRFVFRTITDVIQGAPAWREGGKGRVRVRQPTGWKCKSSFENIEVSMMEVVYLASLGSRPWAIKLAAASCCCAIAVACEGASVFSLTEH